MNNIFSTIGLICLTIACIGTLGVIMYLYFDVMGCIEHRDEELKKK